MKKLTQAIFALVTVCVASNVAGQDTDQKFSATVPLTITVTAPADTTLTHDETDTNQAFAAQTWTVVANSPDGVTVSFATGSAFVHTTDSSSKRDAKLTLSVNSETGPGAFTITQATAQTDYTNSSEVATVTAASDGVSNATLDLAVEFVTGTYGTFAAGTYETTVTGTITAI